MTRPLKARGLLCERGAAMVEYTLALPIYLCIFIGVVNAALVIYTWNATAYAARSATRYAIVHGSTASYACTSTDLKNIVYNSLPGLRKATVTTTWSPNNSPGSTINVNVKLTFSTFVPFIKSQTLALASSSQMTIVQ
jgi:Flp pilus assembly protein TadG